MKRETRIIGIRTDLYTRVCLTAIAVLLTVTVVGLWADAVPMAAPARGADEEPAFGDANAVRKAILKAQEQTNAKLDELIKLLKSGEAKVQTVSPEAKASGGP